MTKYLFHCESSDSWATLFFEGSERERERERGERRGEEEEKGAEKIEKKKKERDTLKLR